MALGATGFDVLVEVAMEDAEAFGRYKNRVLAELDGVLDIEVFMLWDVRKVRMQVSRVRMPLRAGSVALEGEDVFGGLEDRTLRFP